MSSVKIKKYVLRKFSSIKLHLIIIFQEGKQASLAADFSMTQFSHLGRLLIWHGRNRYLLCFLIVNKYFYPSLFAQDVQDVASLLLPIIYCYIIVSFAGVHCYVDITFFVSGSLFSYKRSAALGQFVIHRGLIISVIQVSC